MKAMLAVPFGALSGRTGPDAFVFYHAGGRLVARAYVRPRQPDTPDQRLSRELHGRATAAWRALAPEQRAGWERYAALMIGPAAAETAAGARAGFGLFVRAARHRLLLGADPVTDAPLAAPPPSVAGLTVLPAPGPRALRLAVTHGVADPAAHRIAVRITPAMPGARTPTRHDLRAAQGLAGGASLVPLPESGQTASLDTLRFAIPAAARFGLETTIVRTADGLPGPAVFVAAVNSAQGVA